jgi:hypothetical protein
MFWHAKLSTINFSKMPNMYFTNDFKFLLVPLFQALQFSMGYTVAQWLRHCATSRKVAGSIPDDVTGIFIDIILLATLQPWD